MTGYYLIDSLSLVGKPAFSSSPAMQGHFFSKYVVAAIDTLNPAENGLFKPVSFGLADKMGKNNIKLLGNFP